MHAKTQQIEKIPSTTFYVGLNEPSESAFSSIQNNTGSRCLKQRLEYAMLK